MIALTSNPLRQQWRYWETGRNRVSGFPVREACFLGAPFDDIGVNQMKCLSDFVREETAANAAEYALILMVITAFLVVAVSAIASSISNSFNVAATGIAS